MHIYMCINIPYKLVIIKIYKNKEIEIIEIIKSFRYNVDNVSFQFNFCDILLSSNII